MYEHRPGRTLSEADNTWFTLLTMNNHPLHFDAVYAAKSEFGKPLMNSTLTLAIVTGMSVSDVSQKAVGNLGWTDIRLTAPVFAGDTIYAESEVLTTDTTAVWLKRFAGNIPAAPVNDLPGALENPLVRDDGRLKDYAHSTGSSLRMVVGPVHCPGDDPPARAAPALGADTEELLRELGYEDDRIIDLREAGTI